MKRIVRKMIKDIDPTSAKLTKSPLIKANEVVENKCHNLEVPKYKKDPPKPNKNGMVFQVTVDGVEARFPGAHRIEGDFANHTNKEPEDNKIYSGIDFGYGSDTVSMGCKIGGLSDDNDKYDFEIVSMKYDFEDSYVITEEPVEINQPLFTEKITGFKYLSSDSVGIEPPFMKEAIRMPPLIVENLPKEAAPFDFEKAMKEGGESARKLVEENGEDFDELLEKAAKNIKAHHGDDAMMQKDFKDLIASTKNLKGWSSPHDGPAMVDSNPTIKNPKLEGITQPLTKGPFVRPGKTPMQIWLKNFLLKRLNRRG